MPQSVCIFCGQGKLSKEHFWPDWFGKEIGREAQDIYLEGTILGTPKSDDIEEYRNLRTGNLTTKKFRVVCAACNNGWMSELEEQAKPIIINALHHCDMNLDKSEVLILAKWIAMKTMVAEKTKSGSNVTRECDLLTFGSKQTIPDYYRIYISKHGTGDVTNYSRTACRIGTVATSGERSKESSNNTKTSAFLVGKLFIFVFACTDPTVKILGGFKLNKMKPLKYNYMKSLNFMSLKVLDVMSIQNIVYALEDLINSDKTLAAP